MPGLHGESALQPDGVDHRALPRGRGAIIPRQEVVAPYCGPCVLARKHMVEVGTRLALVTPATRLADGRQSEPLQEHTTMADKDLNARGAENRTEGAAKELEGKVRGKVGDATDNESEQIKGKAQELKGKAQQTFGKGQQKTDENI